MTLMAMCPVCKKLARTKKAGPKSHKRVFSKHGKTKGSSRCRGSYSEEPVPVESLINIQRTTTITGVVYNRDGVAGMLSWLGSGL